MSKLNKGCEYYCCRGDHIIEKKEFRPPKKGEIMIYGQGTSLPEGKERIGSIIATYDHNIPSARFVGRKKEDPSAIEGIWKGNINGLPKDIQNKMSKIMNEIFPISKPPHCPGNFDISGIANVYKYGEGFIISVGGPTWVRNN